MPPSHRQPNATNHLGDHGHTERRTRTPSSVKSIASVTASPRPTLAPTTLLHPQGCQLTVLPPLPCLGLPAACASLLSRLRVKVSLCMLITGCYWRWPQSRGFQWGLVWSLGHRCVRLGRRKGRDTQGHGLGQRDFGMKGSPPPLGLRIACHAHGRVSTFDTCTSDEQPQPFSPLALEQPCAASGAIGTFPRSPRGVGLDMEGKVHLQQHLQEISSHQTLEFTAAMWEEIKNDCTARPPGTSEG